MNRALLPLAVPTLVYAVWNMSTTSFRIGHGWNVDWAYLFLQLFYWPAAILAWICAIGSAVCLILRKSPSTSGLALLFALPMLGYSLYHPEYTTLKKWHHEEALKQRWFEGSQMVNHLLMKYLREHPGATKWPGDDESIDAGEFVAWLREHPTIFYRAFEKPYPLQISGGAVRTPWGSPILFGVDCDGDGYVSFAGKRGSLKAGHADPWADGDFSYKVGVGCLPGSVPPNIHDPGANYMSTLNDRDFERLFEYRERIAQGDR